MLRVTLIGLLAIAACCAYDDSQILDQWNHFLIQHEKSYKSPAEASRRLSIFTKNLKEIKDHNLRYENGEETYYQGVNKFTDWTDEEFLEYASGYVPTFEKKDRHHNDSSLTAPASMDWRTKNAVLTPQDQGDCGACWAFSSTGAVEAQMAIHKGKAQSLSKQNLIDCVRGGKTKGCESGYSSEAYEYIIKNGIEYENEYPYQEKQEECHQTSFAAKISAYEWVPDDEGTIEEYVGTKGPVSVGIQALASLKKYEGGIYSDSECTDAINHAVLLVGYGEEGGTPYWIVKNSWGANWGENGFFRLRKGTNECAVKNQASIPVL